MITLGADPEVFVSSASRFVSGYGMIEGTKREPKKVPNGAVQVDGMALEFNITPAKSADKFIHNINSVMKTLKKMIPAECELDIKSSAHFTKAFLADQPEKATELGCDPDYNAWSLGPNPTPNAATCMRTAAGHVHIGWMRKADVDDIFHIMDCATLVKELDYYLGLPSVFMDVEGAERRKLYGKASAMRIKPYGVEYRTLSNFWLKSPELMKWVFDSTIRAISNMKKGIVLHEKFGSTAVNYIDYQPYNEGETWSNFKYLKDYYDQIFHVILPFNEFLPAIHRR